MSAHENSPLGSAAGLLLLAFACSSLLNTSALAQLNCPTCPPCATSDVSCNDPTCATSDGCCKLYAPVSAINCEFMGDGTYDWSIDVCNEDLCDDAVDFEVALTLTEDGGCSYTETFTIQLLSHDTCDTFSGTIEVPDTESCRDQYCDLSVEVDSGGGECGDVCECEGGEGSENNTFVNQITRYPDLTVQNLQVVWDGDNDEWDFTFRIRNGDQCTAVTAEQLTASSVRFQVFNDCNTTYDDQSRTLWNLGIHDLPAATTTGELTVSIYEDGSDFDDCTVRAIEVDANDAIPESNEANNIVYDTDTEPDLVINNLQCTYDQACSGGYHVEFDVENTSAYETADVSASEFDVRIHGCQGDDYQLTLSFQDDYGIEAIGPRETVSIEVYCIYHEAGCTCCRVEVDSNGVVSESDNDNNTANDNEIQGELLIGEWGTIHGSISNIRPDIPVTITNQLINPPPGWAFEVNPPVIVVPPLSSTSVTLSYLAPDNAESTTLEIRSTEAETGYVQNNLLVLTRFDEAFTDDFEAGLDDWSCTYSTGGTCVGTLCPGVWSADTSTPAIDGDLSAHLFAGATKSCSPYQINAAISTNVGPATHLSLTARFDQIEGGGGTGHSFLQVAVLDAANTDSLYRYTFAPNAQVAGDTHVLVAEGEVIEFHIDFAADFFGKYGYDIPGDVIIRLRASADYAENAPAGQRIRTADVAIDNLRVLTPSVPCSWDLNGDNVIGPADLAALLSKWGPNPGDPADLNSDGEVNAADLAILLGAWGPCS